VASQEFFRSVGNECQFTSLNYKEKILHSHTTQFARDETDSGLSLKYVVRGEERYKIGNQWHRITDGRFLLVNEHQHFQCRVESAVPVEGLCIYPDPASVYEVVHARRAGHAKLLDQGAAPPCVEQVYFFEKIYGLQENAAGKYLQALIPQLRDDARRAAMDSASFFLGLYEHLAESFDEVDLLLQRLDHERKATRDEIFRRVSMAREYIDSHYLEELSLEHLASVAAFSKYHFLRCFKQVYGLAPYQYVLQLRLEAARRQLREGRLSLTEIAETNGFGDRRALNKSFRKAFGINPAEFRIQG
jgi:AraC family transcriptional regulator